MQTRTGLEAPAAHSAAPRRIAAALALALLVALAACSAGSGGSDGATSAPDASLEGIEAPDLLVSEWATGFDGPTQMVFGPDGHLIIAELNGGENDGTGRVLRVDPADRSSRTVLQEDLDKPTGIAVVGDRLWIMERRRLSFTTLEPGAERVVVADELPFNGRSEGTLTVTPDGSLLYNTSGTKRGPDRVEGSGILFEIEDAAAAEPGEPTVIAEGFKHAYTHLEDPDGQLWTVEMTDGTFDGDRAQDELLAIEPGDDAGWPQCVDDNRPVAEYGGTPETCAASPRSHALFGAGATPTSLVLAPWDPDLFIVALWLPSQIVTVPRTPPTNGPHEPTVIVEGIESPQHLLVDGDTILVSDHDSGRIFELSRP